MNMYNGKITYMKFDSWDNMHEKFLELTKDLKEISFFKLEKFVCAYIFSDEKIYIIECISDEDFEYDAYSLEIVSISDYILNMQKDIDMLTRNCDTKMDKYNALLKEKDFLFKKLDEVMPVYNNASVIAVENEKLKKDLEVLKEEKIKSVNEVLRLRVEISNLYKLLGVKWKDSMVYKELLEEEIARNKED